jgi:hypothetical protein
MAQAVFGFDEQLECVSEIDVVVMRCFRRVLSLDAVCSLYFCCCDPSPFLWFGLFGSSTSAARRSGIGSLGIWGVLDLLISVRRSERLNTFTHY